MEVIVYNDKYGETYFKINKDTKLINVFIAYFTRLGKRGCFTDLNDILFEKSDYYKTVHSLNMTHFKARIPKLEYI